MSRNLSMCWNNSNASSTVFDMHQSLIIIHNAMLSMYHRCIGVFPRLRGLVFFSFQTPKSAQGCKNVCRRLSATSSLPIFQLPVDSRRQIETINKDENLTLKRHLSLWEVEAWKSRTVIKEVWVELRSNHLSFCYKINAISEFRYNWRDSLNKKF